MAQDESPSASVLPLSVDDSSFSSLIHHACDDRDDEVCINPMMSDAKYAEELQFQEAIMASSALVCETTNNIASCSSSTLTIQARQAVQSSLIHEVLDPEAENSSHILCGICVEFKESDQMFTNNTCAHSFCSDCITKQVAAKLDESFHIVSCPGLDCKSVLELEDCAPILSKLVLERWNEALCEALVLGSQKVYCPFSDCSMVLVIEDEGEIVRESECPACIDCSVRMSEFRGIPGCKFLVERSQGCLHITCRCQFQFCYGCGAEWTRNHGGCQSQCNRN
ncbi:hypothetical protein M0R45_031296 [Rubus argutus]|uniref:RBR-type E3 ubiquitin transferase n=1 Tax=Rubus argutus TaxID=59490 RepID=A0AAW1WFZ9_RUBAR